MAKVYHRKSRGSTWGRARSNQGLNNRRFRFLRSDATEAQALRRAAMGLPRWPVRFAGATSAALNIAREDRPAASEVALAQLVWS